MGGKAYCVVHKQALFTIDINGQMDEQVQMSNKSGQIYNLDEQDTGKLPKPSRSGNPNYDGPPIHTLTIFANPFIDDEPNILEEGVLAIQPGEEVAIAHNYISTVELYISEIWFGNINTHKGTFQKLLSRFCPYPPFPLSFFEHNDFPLSRVRKTPSARQQC